ncbi:MAG: serine/threonine-protein kinase, partial [Myxococcota bacterium]
MDGPFLTARRTRNTRLTLPQVVHTFQSGLVLPFHAYVANGMSKGPVRPVPLEGSGPRADASMNAIAPTSIGPYVIDRRLATGGMAELFIAERRGPHGFSKRVALKRILPQYLADPDFKSMFIDEAKVAARMSHPGVVQVFDFGEHEGELFLAMELVEGTHVGRVIRSANRQEQSIPLEVALHITARTAHALAYAHRQGGDDAGFVHRDVSPANILLTATGHVKLTDFGIAKMSHQSRHTEDGHVRGKLGYMSPEQVLGRALDGRSDVFTLATVFAEMLIGQPLFGEGSELDILVRIRDVDLTPLERSPARIPKDVLTLLKTGLARMPEDRPSAAAFAEACEEVRRRRAMAHGPERTARLLKRLHLTDVAGNDNGTTGETTALVDTSNLAPEAADLIRGIDTSKNVYRVRLASGDEVGPVSYPRLVQMITSGQVTSDTVIAKADGHFVPASEMPELTRFVTSPAISWSPGEPANASRRGDITTGRM